MTAGPGAGARQRGLGPLRLPPRHPGHPGGGLFKLSDLTGPLGNGLRGQALVAMVITGVTALLSVRFLMRYFKTRTLTPFGIYCLAFGTFMAIYIAVQVSPHRCRADGVTGSTRDGPRQSCTGAPGKMLSADTWQVSGGVRAREGGQWRDSIPGAGSARRARLRCR